MELFNIRLRGKIALARFVSGIDVFKKDMLSILEGESCNPKRSSLHTLFLESLLSGGTLVHAATHNRMHLLYKIIVPKIV